MLHFLRSVSGAAADPSDPTRLRLIPAVAAACFAVARLVQDCPENQRRLAGGGGDDQDPVLFKLLAVDGEGRGGGGASSNDRGQRGHPRPRAPQAAGCGMVCSNRAKAIAADPLPPRQGMALDL